MSPAAGLARRAAVGAVGTGAPVMVVAGSGTQAARLTHDEVLGAGVGAVLANAMFGLPLMQLSARAPTESLGEC